MLCLSFRFLQMLEVSKASTEREDPFQTYSRLETAASNLQEHLVAVQEALDGARREQAFTGARLERDRDVLDQVVYSDIVQPLLRPQVCATATPALELCPHAQVCLSCLSFFSPPFSTSFLVNPKKREQIYLSTLMACKKHARHNCLVVDFFCTVILLCCCFKTLKLSMASAFFPVIATPHSVSVRHFIGL